MSIPIEKIKYGTKVIVLDVAASDSAYEDKKELLGRLGTIVKDGMANFPISVGEGGWFSCTISFEDGPLQRNAPFYFLGVKFRLATDEEIVQAEQKKAKSETPVFSCSEIEFLVVLESARKWYMLREHPEWGNEDYFKRFPKDPKLYTLQPESETSSCSCCSLWSKNCGDGTTNCPLDKRELYCNSQSDFPSKGYRSGQPSPWWLWNTGSCRRVAADKIFQAMIDWLVEHKR